MIYAGSDDGSLQVTRDGGRTWTDIARNLPGMFAGGVVAEVVPSRFDVATEQLDPALPVLREHELALTGGVERSEFETMFGLNHERLRSGGNQLIKGEGDLGSALVVFCAICKPLRCPTV